MADVIFSMNNGEETCIIPLILEEIPEIKQDYDNQTLQTDSGTITLLGSASARSFSLHFLIPEHSGKYRFAKSVEYDDAMEFVDFFRRAAEQKIPIRLVITNGMQELLNIALALNSLSWKRTRQMNVEISIDVSEFNFVKTAKKVSDSKDGEPEVVTATEININGKSVKVNRILQSNKNYVELRSLENGGFKVDYVDGKATIDNKINDVSLDINNEVKNVGSINVSGYNYVNLRSMCKALNIYINYDDGKIVIDKEKNYVEENSVD